MRTDSQVAVQPDAEPWHTIVDQDETYDDLWPCHLWVSWYSREDLPLDELIRSVEDKKVEWVTLVMPHARIAVHPYNGGIDVLLPTPEQRDEWHDRYATWASERPDGL